MAHRLLNHGPTTLVTTAHGGRRNVMAAAWVMPIDFEPPRFAALSTQADLTYAVGSCSGRDGDKFDRLGLACDPGTAGAAPLLHGCAAWLECRRLPEPANEERYDLFVLECVAAWADDALWRDGGWHFPAVGPHTIHHERGGRFFRTGEPLTAARPPRQTMAPNDSSAKLK
jgi:flavin reductase (DIM6/NTAB) family NADH-FMN oxidoreductase RutF